jgi:alpha-L-fucosidase 2
MLHKMPDYRINENGAVAEWTTSKLVDNNEHRHVSHLVALYDGLPDDIAADPVLRRAFKKVIENRMGPRRANGGGEMSFGLVQLGQSAASLGEAELAYEAVDLLANSYWRSNLVSTHNPNSIFNVDICGGMPAVIIKMLIASKPGEITLLPALPRQWPAGHIDGVLCRGQIEVKRLAWDNADVTLSVRSKIAQEVRLSVGGGIESITTEDGRVTIGGQSTAAGGRSIALPADETVTLNIRRR